MRPNSIRARMTTAFVAAITTVILIVCGGILWYAKHTAERNANTVMKAMAERVQHEVETEGSQAGLADEIQDMKSDNLAFLIVDNNGKIVRRSIGNLPTWPRRGNDGWGVVTATSGRNTIVIGKPWTNSPEELQFKNLAMALALVGVIVIVAAGIGAWLLVGRTLSPIGALSREAEAASSSSESLNVRLAAPSRDTEVVELVRTLNALLARLAETAASKGRFYAAASHELRTPLQALFGHLDVALKKDRAAPEYRTAIEEAYEQAERLTWLVRDLLLLNQLETATSRPQCETVNIADICERMLQHYQSLASKNRLHIRADFPGDVDIEAPPTHAHMLVRNLVENAVKYAAPGGAVSIAVTRNNGSARIDLSNECAPLSEDVVGHLFEPFYRPDAARDSENGGNGLGLAICKAIAISNGWELSLEPYSEGMRATVLFR